jgi:type II secretory pathway pseudopilin PulG
MFKNNFKTKGGYTIIETMIAIAVFLVIVMEGMGALLNASNLHQKAQNLRSIMDNMSFIMDDMSRNIRTGYNYHCFANVGDIPPGTPTPDIIKTPLSCDSGIGKGLAFESANGRPDINEDQWVYYINGGKIYKATSAPYSNPITDPLSGFYQLTPGEVNITDASSFSVLGAEPPPGDSQQPIVIIRLVGTITIKNVVTPFSLQTSVSQRLVDI